MKPTVERRFWEKVQKAGRCWEWRGATNRVNGYGQFYIDGQNVMAHRFVYELSVGAIPDGLSVLHTCDNPRCVRPEHLWLGTQSDNMQDAGEKGRTTTVGKARRTRCPAGHPYNEANTRYYRGWRYCRVCQRQWKRKKKALAALDRTEEK